MAQPKPRHQSIYEMPSHVALRRPRTRADCINGPRPCPWVSCRHHLATDIGSSLKVREHLLPWMGQPSCVLDLADLRPEGFSTEEIASLLGVTNEAVRITLVRALERVEGRLHEDGSLRRC